MIKKTLYFGNPAYLSLKNKQLLIRLPEVANNKTLPDNFKTEAERTIPIEDIGMIILDNKRLTITQGVLEELLANNCALITCDSTRMPVGLMLPLDGNSVQTERYRDQIEASLPLKKQLWQQTVQSKIRNQAFVLSRKNDAVVKNMEAWANQVRSGDPDNLEARSAVYYWANLFPEIEGFYRERDGIAPNNLLNYGYAILRSVVARALVSTGLLPSIGIFHKSKYNAYCLADDIMEPYRPYVDNLVCEIIADGEDIATLSKEVKARLLNIPVLDVTIEGNRRPLMNAVTQTTASLYNCFSGRLRKIKYPTFEA